MTRELRNLIYGKSSVFIGSIETPLERIVYSILYNTLKTGGNVVWVCLKEPPGSVLDRFSSYDLDLKGMVDGLWFIDATAFGDRDETHHTIRCRPMDYAELSLQVGNMLRKHHRTAVMLDSLGIIAALENINRIVRLMRYLDGRIRSVGGTFITTMASKALPVSIETEIIKSMDIIVRVEENEILAHIGSKDLIMPFTFNGSDIIIDNKGTEKELKELFSLNPKEKELLELEVEEKTRLYRELID